MDAIFGEEGCLKDILSFYEYRESQKLMAEKVSEAISNNRNAIIEAGTGTGKTLAYLIPSIKYCIDNDKILAISTATKNLQIQLTEKDLPIIQKLFYQLYKVKFNYSLCLGSSNYPCLNKFNSGLNNGSFMYMSKDEVAMIENLFNNKELFTKYDINIASDLWSSICRNSEDCKGNACPYIKNCVFMNTKKLWKKSKVLVLNHSLFFTNIAIGKTYLPFFDNVIFDESHFIIQTASEQLGFQIDSFTMLKISSLIRKEKKLSLKKAYTAMDNKRILKLLSEIEKLFHTLLTECDRLLGYQRTYRLKKPMQSSFPIVEKAEELYVTIKTMKIKNNISDDIISDLEIIKSYFFTLYNNLNSALSNHIKEWVYYIGKNKNSIFIKGLPINIAEVLEETVYSFYSSSIFTSATLSIDNKFDFIKKQLGLKDFESGIFPTPYNYRECAITYIPPIEFSSNDAEYLKTCINRCLNIIEKINGNCLFLFTSYSSIRIFRKLFSELSNRQVFSQDEYDASTALQMFIDNPGGILLGTDSFWQGIDLSGDLLKAVFIIKLPFSPPDDPFMEAVCEKIIIDGGNPFYDYQIPSAIIKFKQGIGRLIRGFNDKGVITIFDNRIISKGYGRHFIKSVPNMPITNKQDDIINFIERKFVDIE